MEEFVFWFERFFNFDYYFGIVEYFFLVRDNFRANRRITFVLETRTDTCALFYQNFVTRFDERISTCGRQTNAIFIVLDFLSYADNHIALPPKKFSFCMHDTA